MSETSETPTRPVIGLSALRCTPDGAGHFYSTRWLRPGAAAKFVELAERSGLLRPAVADDDCYAVLDMLDAEHDIADDRAVPDEAAWNALNSELGLFVVAVEGGPDGHLRGVARAGDLDNHRGADRVARLATQQRSPASARQTTRDEGTHTQG